MFKFGKKKSLTMKYLGETCLHQKAAPIGEITDDIRSLGEAMLEVMYKQDGVGLAAPQVGISLRLVTLDVPEPKDPGMPLSPGERELLPLMPLVLVNPEIVMSSEKCSSREEGCLSVPGLYAPVCRPDRVVLRTQIMDGDFIEIECGGLLGRCIQHELDHLDGKLFTDRVEPETARQIRGDLDRLTRIGQSRNFRRNK